MASLPIPIRARGFLNLAAVPMPLMKPKPEVPQVPAKVDTTVVVQLMRRMQWLPVNTHITQCNTHTQNIHESVGT